MSLLLITPALSQATLQASAFLGNGSILKTLDLLFYLMIGAGIILVIGVALVFVWEYRKFKRLFREHKFL